MPSISIEIWKIKKIQCICFCLRLIQQEFKNKNCSRQTSSNTHAFLNTDHKNVLLTNISKNNNGK